MHAVYSIQKSWVKFQKQNDTFKFSVFSKAPSSNLSQTPLFWSFKNLLAPEKIILGKHTYIAFLCECHFQKTFSFL